MKRRRGREEHWQCEIRAANYCELVEQAQSSSTGPLFSVHITIAWLPVHLHSKNSYAGPFFLTNLDQLTKVLVG